MMGTPTWLARLALVAALFLAVGPGPSATGQSPSLAPVPTTGPRFDELVSDDGLLTLTVPFGVDADASTLSIVTLPAQAPAIARYELRPLDTSFEVPVKAMWRPGPAGLPVATDGDLVWLGMARASGTVSGHWSWLDDPHISVVDGSYAVTGDLGRFGTLIVTRVTTLVRGPEAMWGPGYAPGLGTEVPMDLTLVTPDGTPSTAAFIGYWRFDNGDPGLIDVTTTVSGADHLAASWRCQRIADTSLTTTFGVQEAARVLDPTGQSLGLDPAGADFSVTFPVACGRVHPRPNG